MASNATIAKRLRDRAAARARAATNPEDNGPNARVVELRRALLLGGSGGSVKHVDLSRAENPLDVAFTRGWITGDQHRAARRYARLFVRHSRRVLGDMPGVGSSSTRFTGSLIAPSSDARMTAGVNTPADFALAEAIRQFDAQKISKAALEKAERQHRAASIDWSRMADSDVVAIFNVALELDNSGAAFDADPSEDTATLRSIWDVLEPSEARALFSFAVLEAWPNWIIGRASGKVESHQDPSHRTLLRALDAAARALGSGPRQAAPRPVYDRHATAPRRIGSPGRTEYVHYVYPTGELMFEVERRVPHFPALGAEPLAQAA